MNPHGGGIEKSPRPVNIDANHLLTTHPSGAQPGAYTSAAPLGFLSLKMIGTAKVIK